MTAVSAPKRFSFKKQERLLKKTEFLAVTEGGKKSHTENFIVFSRPNVLGFPRMGVTISRKVGNSADRNRIKRFIREFFRLNKAGIGTGIDIVVIAKRGVASEDFKEVSRQLGRALIPVSMRPSDDTKEKRD